MDSFINFINSYNSIPNLINSYNRIFKMNRGERRRRSFWARQRRKSIKRLKMELLVRMREKRRSLRKKYNKLKEKRGF